MTVIGVMPRGFRGLRVDDGVDIIAPFGTVRPSPANRLLASHILGRLRPGVTLEAARAELVTRWPAMMHRVTTTLPPAEQRNLRDVTIRVDAVGTGFSFLRTRYEQPLWIGSALTLGLLLLACVNVGGLALSRVVARGGELAMRTALGASRLRLARQLVLEMLVVAGAGTILGIGVAWVTVKPIASALPFGGLQPTLSITPDARVLFVTALAGLATGLLASLLPVWLASRRAMLQLHTDRTVAATSRPGRALLVAQVALSVALLMSAGLVDRQNGVTEDLFSAGEPNVRQLERSAVVYAQHDSLARAARPIAFHVAASRAANCRGKLSSWHLTTKRVSSGDARRFNTASGLRAPATLVTRRAPLSALRCFVATYASRNSAITSGRVARRAGT